MGAIGGDGVSIIEALPLDGSQPMTGPLTIDQNSNALSLDIDSEATTADVINISPAVLTTGNVIDVPDADALTTGKILNLMSDSADTGTRTLVQITNDNTLATGTTALSIQQDAAQRGLFIDQNANASALVIDSEATTQDVISIPGAKITTAFVLDIADADALTTGSLARFRTNAADTSARELVQIFNDNPASIGTTCIKIIQDAANQVMILDQNAASSFIDFQGAAAANTTGPISTLTTSGATTHHLQIEINGVKAWVAASTADPS